MKTSEEKLFEAELEGKTTEKLGLNA